MSFVQIVIVFIALVGVCDVFCDSRSLRGDREAVLFVAENVHTGAFDVFASDASGDVVDISQGRATEMPWNEPWEPVGRGKEVVFRQYMNNGTTRIFLASYEDKLGWTLKKIPTYFGRAAFVDWPGGDIPSFAFVDQSLQKVTDFQVYVISTKTLQVTRTIPISTKSFPTRLRWSEDGKWIGVSTYEGIFLTSPDGTPKPTPIPTDPGSGLAFGPNSQSLAIVKERKMSIVDLDGKILKTFDQEALHVFDWSSDGKYISYQGISSSTGRNVDILTVGTETSAEVKTPGDNNCAMWSQDSTMLAFYDISTITGVCSVGIVNPPSGQDYKVLGGCAGGGYSPPSWCVVASH